MKKKCSRMFSDTLCNFIYELYYTPIKMAYDYFAQKS